MKNKHFAFTLAETLITLVIIGVIAAITVPVMMNATNQAQFIERCKKMYSTFAQAKDLAEMTYGPMTTWEFSAEGGDSIDSVFVKKFVLPYVIKAKDCGTTLTNSCTFRYKYLNAQNHENWASGWHKIILNDGATAVFRYSATGNESYKWVILTVDVNGDSKPNVMGKDQFTFVYWLKRPDERSGKFEAYGADWSRESLINNTGANACNMESTGQLCAALLMKDSWQMLDDYPVR